MCLHSNTPNARLRVSLKLPITEGDEGALKVYVVGVTGYLFIQRLLNAHRFCTHSKCSKSHHFWHVKEDECGFLETTNQVADGETEVLVSKCTPQNGRCLEELGSDHEKRSLPIHGTSHSSALQSSVKILHGLPKKVLACLAGSEAVDRGFAGSSFGVSGFRTQSLQSTMTW